MYAPPVSLTLRTPQHSCDLARRMAPLLGPGHVLLLEGGIGAGKTHFARCLIGRLLEAPEDIPSPTFTLVQTYRTTCGELWHADLYRLDGPEEVIELGLAEAFVDALCLVEWPDRLADLCPADALTLAFASGDAEDERHLTLDWTASRWPPIVERALQ